VREWGEAVSLSRKVLYQAPAGSRIGDADLSQDGGELLVVQRRADSGKRELVFPKSSRTLPLADNVDYCRALPEGRVLAMSIRVSKQNGRILSPDGAEERVFDLDAPVCDALVDWQDGEFWVSYFRMGVPVGLAGEGLVRFNARGEPIIKLRSEFSGPESAGDTHPFCLGRDSKIWMLPEPDYYLLELDWSRWSVRSRRVPWDAHGADAITARTGVVYMAGAKQHTHAVHAYHLREDLLEQVGEIRGRPRPVLTRHGLFLDILPHEVALLVPGS